MWPISTEAAVALQRRERRESPREKIGEEAELFIPAEGMTIPCIVANLSAGGAKIECDVVPPSGSNVVLHFQGRRIDAVLAWDGDEEFGLGFAVSYEKFDDGLWFPVEVMQAPSVTNTLGTACSWFQALSIDVFGSFPIRHVPA